MRYGDNRLGAFEPDRVHVFSPFSFRAERLFLTNPGLSYFGHLGAQIGKVHTFNPGTSCLATISRSPPGQKQPYDTLS